MGFAPDWLRLRAPADAAARDPGLAAAATQMAADRAGGDAPCIVDLGAGTGATMRALAPILPDGAQWRLIDNDPALLACPPRLGGRARTVHADLTALDALPLDGAALVTASALLDLASQDWLDGLAARLAACGLPFYAALSYDGRMRWEPALPGDGAITDAFNRDQRSDKGIGGPALGPDAASRAADAFERAGYIVQLADSPWRLGPDMAQLQAGHIAGVAHAAARAGMAGADAWQSARRDLLDSTQAVIGHQDLLAVPRAGRGAQ